jgi:hypothetical protein
MAVVPVKAKAKVAKVDMGVQVVADVSQWILDRIPRWIILNRFHPCRRQRCSALQPAA